MRNSTAGSATTVMSRLVDLDDDFLITDDDDLTTDAALLAVGEATQSPRGTTALFGSA